MDERQIRENTGHTEVNRTQRWMIEALLRLMENKDFREISVVDLVNEAQLGRRTFYRYFKSREDLLLLYCYLLVDEYAAMAPEHGGGDIYTFTLAYFQFWAGHIEFLKLLEKSNMLSFIGERLPEFVARAAAIAGPGEDGVLTRLARHMDDGDDYLNTFKLGGYWSITTKWVAKPRRESPEEMARMITETVFGQSAEEPRDEPEPEPREELPSPPPIQYEPKISFW